MKKSLADKLNDVSSALNIEYLLKENESADIIKDYYRTNKISYRLFHNWSGFLHMGISKNGVYKKLDLLEQPKEVEQYIKSLDAKNILELGAGRGANSFFLAERNPTITFYAIDFSTSPIKKYIRKNLTFNFADYHNLSIFDDNFFDVIFAIETVCHSDKKEVVLREVYKKLKKGGVFIIFDGYLSKDRNLLNEEQKTTCVLIEKGMAINEFESLESFNKKVISTGFTVLKEENLSENILPTLLRFEKMANKFFKNKFLQKILTFIFPEKVIRNSISGYLMPNFIEEKIGFYIKHVLQK